MGSVYWAVRFNGVFVRELGCCLLPLRDPVLH